VAAQPIPDFRPEILLRRAPDHDANMTALHEQLLAIGACEQNGPLSLRLAQRAYVIELGRVTLEGTGQQLLADPHVREAYLA